LLLINNSTVKSAGFDGFESDPLGGDMGLKEMDYSWMTRKVIMKN
jgi:acetoin utilization deacetylase AcuC-like enzyme